MGIHRFEDVAKVLAGRQDEVASLVDGIARSGMTGASDYYAAETPVKTGAARSNWVATVDEPFEGIIPPYAPYEDLGNGPAPVERKFETSNAEAAKAQNQTAFALFTAKVNRAIFLRNNVEHIGLLNNEPPRSAQTSAGWFERGVAAAILAMSGKWQLKA